MLTLDLLQLRRERGLPVEGGVASEAGLWSETGLAFSGPLEFMGRASVSAEGGVVVQGRVTGTAVYECGRCLEEVTYPVDLDLVLIFMSAEGWAEEDPEIRTIGYNERTLDLSESIREEVILALPRYYVHPLNGGQGCTESTGTVSAPGSASEDVDPRWSALRALKDNDKVD